MDGLAAFPETSNKSTFLPRPAVHIAGVSQSTAEKMTPIILILCAAPSHHVTHFERCRRLPHFRPPHFARALPAATHASLHNAVVTRARPCVAAVAVPCQPAPAAAVPRLSALHCCFSPCMRGRSRVWLPLGAPSRCPHHETIPQRHRVASLARASARLCIVYKQRRRRRRSRR